MENLEWKIERGTQMLGMEWNPFPRASTYLHHSTPAAHNRNHAPNPSRPTGPTPRRTPHFLILPHISTFGCKALICGLNTIKAVKLLAMPEPDFVGVQIDQFPYESAEQYGAVSRSGGAGWRFESYYFTPQGLSLHLVALKGKMNRIHNNQVAVPAGAIGLSRVGTEKAML